MCSLFFFIREATAEIGKRVSGKGGGGTIPENGTVRLVRVFFFLLLLNKSQCKSKKTNKFFLQFEEKKGTRGTYCTERGEEGGCPCLVDVTVFRVVVLDRTYDVCERKKNRAGRLECVVISGLVNAK